MKALVVFSDRSGICLARFLRPGYRHCFVALVSGGYWIVFDGRAGQPDLEVAAGADFDLAAFYRRCGLNVIETSVTRRRPLQPIMLGTCVGAAKRLLGISALLAFTPYGLYQHLRKAAKLSQSDL
jgi:hypothetical protein